MFANLCMPPDMALHRIMYVIEICTEEDKQKEGVIEIDFWATE